jgi:hypothetical protein
MGLSHWPRFEIEFGHVFLSTSKDARPSVLKLKRLPSPVNLSPFLNLHNGRPKWRSSTTWSGRHINRDSAAKEIVRTFVSHLSEQGY